MKRSASYRLFVLFHVLQRHDNVQHRWHYWQPDQTLPADILEFVWWKSACIGRDILQSSISRIIFSNKLTDMVVFGRSKKTSSSSQPHIQIYNVSVLAGVNCLHRKWSTENNESLSVSKRRLDSLEMTHLQLLMQIPSDAPCLLQKTPTFDHI